MGLQERFNQFVLKNKWWQPKEKVVVAVSAGVDSVVLLHLLNELPREMKPSLHVAHINHQLRAISEEESCFVRELCLKLGIPFYESVWEKGPTIKQNVELAAREYRYSFFAKVMKEEQIGKLLTAHHEDDQVETLMMRLITGGSLSSLVGIEAQREFVTGQLIRPLLEIKKGELYQFAKDNQIDFYEDETNHETTYLRNRFRHNLLPQMKEENPKLNEQLLRVQEELVYALEIVEKNIAPLYEESVAFLDNSCQINVADYVSYTLSEQHFLLNKISEECLRRFKLVISKRQQELIHDLLVSDHPNVTQKLKEDWLLTRSYNQAEILQQKTTEKKLTETYLNLNEGIYLSDSEWIGFFKENLEIPKELKTWQKKSWVIPLEEDTQLLIRKRKPGDRFIMDSSGKRKKVSRYFIDEKIPQEKREKSWIAEDNQGEVKCLVPFRESYLSIRDETDKIHYKLVYLYKKDK